MSDPAKEKAKGYTEKSYVGSRIAKIQKLHDKVIASAKKSGKAREEEEKTSASTTDLVTEVASVGFEIAHKQALKPDQEASDMLDPKILTDQFWGRWDILEVDTGEAWLKLKGEKDAEAFSDWCDSQPSTDAGKKRVTKAKKDRNNTKGNGTRLIRNQRQVISQCLALMLEPILEKSSTKKDFEARLKKVCKNIQTKEGRDIIKEDYQTFLNDRAKVQEWDVKARKKSTLVGLSKMRDQLTADREEVSTLDAQIRTFEGNTLKKDFKSDLKKDSVRHVELSYIKGTK
tara:strand:- start:295 stop:1155 length:861 start_codon:yes stop_codon:yes gene_type:complete